MANQENTPETVRGATSAPNAENSPSLEGRVNLWGIIIISIYQILITLLFGYLLLAFWPADLATVTQAMQPSSAYIFGIELSLFNEARMLVLIGLIGALGAQVRSLRSLYWYIGNRKLVWSWVVMYIMLPFVGAIIGAIFYFVIRAGFFSASATIQDANPIGFIALSGLSGMFSEQAVIKLKHVAETLLAEPPAGSDSAPQEKQKE